MGWWKTFGVTIVYRIDGVIGDHVCVVCIDFWNTKFKCGLLAQIAATTAQCDNFCVGVTLQAGGFDTPLQIYRHQSQQNGVLLSMRFLLDSTLLVLYEWERFKFAEVCRS